MWHWNTAAALVSFSSIPFEETFFSNADPKIVCWILSKAASLKLDVMCTTLIVVQEDEQKQHILNHKLGFGLA